MSCYYNIVGTDSTCTAPLQPNCQHENGWYVRVNFWIFSKRIFVCSDCGQAKEQQP